LKLLLRVRPLAGFETLTFAIDLWLFGVTNTTISQELKTSAALQLGQCQCSCGGIAMPCAPFYRCSARSMGCQNRSRFAEAAMHLCVWRLTGRDQKLVSN
jgi:hypothetical protein